MVHEKALILFPEKLGSSAPKSFAAKIFCSFSSHLISFCVGFSLFYEYTPIMAAFLIEFITYNTNDSKVRFSIIIQTRLVVVGYLGIAIFDLLNIQ